MIYIYCIIDEYNNSTYTNTIPENTEGLRIFKYDEEQYIYIEMSEY